MAFYKTGILAEDLRGKLGSVVFSRNNAGIFIRKLVIPRNPRTNAQQLSRTAVRTASQAYAGLTDSQKSQWISYAIEEFSPLNVKNVTYTGANAYVSLFTEVFKSNALPKAAVPSPSNITQEDFTVANTPPNFSGGMNFFGHQIVPASTGKQFRISGTNLQLEARFYLGSETSPETVPISQNQYIVNSANKKIGLVFFYRRKKGQLVRLGATGILKYTGTNPLNFQFIDIIAKRNLADLIQIPAAGETVTIYVVGESENGILGLITSFPITRA